MFALVLGLAVVPSLFKSGLVQLLLSVEILSLLLCFLGRLGDKNLGGEGLTARKQVVGLVVVRTCRTCVCSQ